MAKKKCFVITNAPQMLQSCKTKGENDMNIEVALKRKERGKKKIQGLSN